MKLKTFKIGGIHPPANKFAAQSPIEPLAPPDRAFVLLNQHLGAPAVPVVKKGEKVKVGTLIGRGEAFISAHVHSPISGTVKALDDVSDVSGYRHKAVIIERQDDEWEDSIDRSQDLDRNIRMEPGAIIDKIKEMGIVGLGGAAFPAHIKYYTPGGKKADTLIINGVECESYVTADHRVMLEKTEEIIVGVRIMMTAGKVDRAYIGIEANKPDALEKMIAAAAKEPAIQVVPLKVKYPQGAEKQLIKALVNREVPSGKLPLDVGCIINNVGTTLAIYEAVQKNKPLVERVVTVSSKSLELAGNYLVRIGTPSSALLSSLVKNTNEKGIPTGIGKVIFGGPMMGKAVTTLEVPVTKGTSSIVLMEESKSLGKKPAHCIRCGNCVAACPMGLEPYLLEKLAAKERFAACEKNAIFDCIECGSCTFTCPAARPLIDYIRFGKVNVMRIMRERARR